MLLSTRRPPSPKQPVAREIPILPVLRIILNMIGSPAFHRRCLATYSASGSARNLLRGLPTTRVATGLVLSDRDKLLSFFLGQRDALTRFLARRVGNPDMAEDLAQETWLRLATGTVPTSIANPQAFVFRVAANVATDSLRQRTRLTARHAPPEAALGVPDPAPTAEADVEARERLRALETALDALPPKARAALLMCRISGLTHAVIARELGVSESMVAKYIAQGMRCCRDWHRREAAKN